MPLLSLDSRVRVRAAAASLLVACLRLLEERQQQQRATYLLTTRNRNSHNNDRSGCAWDYHHRLGRSLRFPLRPRRY